jgi:hypothetical protein
MQRNLIWTGGKEYAGRVRPAPVRPPRRPHGGAAWLLGLQRTHGNRQVQRLIQAGGLRTAPPSKKKGGKPPTAPKKPKSTPTGPRACVKSEKIPDKQAPITNMDGSVYGYFEMNVDWEDAPEKGCECRCGEYRQYIKGYVKVNGVKQEKKLWGGAVLEETVYHEDGDDAGHPYGHRGEPETSIDRFDGPDRATACRYRGLDMPGFEGVAGVEVDFSLTFKGQTYDVCTTTFGTIHEWTVSYKGTIL